MRSFALLFQLAACIALFALGVWCGGVAYRDNSPGLGMGCFILCAVGAGCGSDTLNEMKRPK